MSAYIIGGVVALVVTLILLRNPKNKAKQRGIPVDCGGEKGYAIRNAKYPIPLESGWEGSSTLAELFESACKRHSDKPLLGTRNLISKEVVVTEDGRTFEKLHLGDYEWLTYAMTFEKVCNFASGLARIGHSRGESLAIFANTRAEWFIAMQACFRRSVTVVTVYASLGEEALCHSLNETKATTVICGNSELKKLVGLSGQLATVKRVICMDDEIPSRASSVGRWTIISHSDVEKLGPQNPEDADLPLKNDIAVIMYTSGSTGTPKGVMMTHANILATASSVLTFIPGLGNKDVYLAYLPLAHILEITAENLAACVGVAIGYGSPLTLTDTSNKIKRGTKGDVTVLRPTTLLAVPAILDRVRDGVRKKVDAKGGLSKRLFDLACRRRLAAVNGSWFGAWGPETLLWNLLVFWKIRAVLGGRIRYLISGGAPLSSDTQRFFNICFGVTINQVYALSETCGAGTASEVDDLSVGRVGNPFPCSYVKLIDWPEGGYLTSDSPMPRGEIIIGGPNVAVGYLKNEDKTKEVFKVDERGMRWCYTGDIGQIHADGCLEIIDRKKGIVKLQHGEYVSLGKVETALIASPYVDNLMVHADPFHSYCVAIAVGAQPALQDWASKQGISFIDFADLCAKNETIKEVQASLFKEAKKARLDKFEIPAKIKLLSDPWTPESGLVTASLKIKRESIRKVFAQHLNKLHEL